MSVLVNASSSIARLYVQGKSANTTKSIDKIETLVSTTSAVNGSIVAIQVPNNKAATNPLVTPVAPLGEAIYFNGTTDYLTVNGAVNYQLMANTAPPAIANATQFGAPLNNQTFIHAPAYKTGNSYAYYFNGSNDYVSFTNANNVLGGGPIVGSGGSIQFNGTNRIGFSSNSATQAAFNFGTSNFTWECWATIDSIGNGWELMGFWDGNNSPRSQSFMLVALSSSGGLGLDTAGGLAMTATVVNSISLSTGQWYHFALVRNGSTFSTYINGVLNNTYTSSSSFVPTAYPLSIGDYIDGYSTGYGSITNLRIVNGTAVYTSAFSPPTTPLTAISGTQLLLSAASSGAFITDTSTNAFTLTNTGTATYNAATPFVSGGLGTQFLIDMWFNKQSNTSSTLFHIGEVTTNTGFGLIKLESIAGGANNQILNLSVGNTGLAWGILNAANVGVHQSGVWNHVAIARTQANNFYVWLNGYRTYSNTTWLGANLAYVTNYPSSTNNYVYLGWAPAGNGYFNGYLSTFRFMTSNTGNTLNYIYPADGSQFTVPQLPLANGTQNTYVTALLTFQNNTVYDTGSYGVPANTVTQTGNVPLQVNNVALNMATAIASNTLLSSTPSFSTYATLMTGNTIFTVANTSALNFGGNNFCVECWVYPTAAPSTAWTTIIDIANGAIGATVNDAQMRIAQNISSAGYGTVVTNGSGSTTTINTGYGTLPLNTWSHLALVKNNRGYRFYRNGSLVGTSTANTVNPSSATFYANNNLAIGVSHFPADGNVASNSTFKGYISNLRIVNGNTVYDSNFIPPTAAFSNSQFANNLALLTFNSATLTDQSPNALTISNTGAYSIVSTTINQSLFDFNNHNWCVDGWVYLNELTSTTGLNTYPAIWEITPITNDETNKGNLYINQNIGLIYRAGGATVLTAPPLPQRQWNYVALQKFNGTIQLFVNGMLQNTVTSSTWSSATSNSYYSTVVGDNINLYGLNVRRLNGSVSNMRITKGGPVIQSFTPPTTNLTANSSTLLLTAQSNAIIENSQYANAYVYWAPVANTVITGSYTPFSNTYSILFTGASASTNRVPHNANLSLATGDWTIECWSSPQLYNSTNSSATMVLFSKDFLSATYYSSYELAWITETSASGTWFKPRLQIGSGNGQTSQQTLTGNVDVNSVSNSNNWYHMAATKNGANVYLWLNGTLVNTATQTATITDGARSLTVGYAGGPTNYFTGHISNLRVIKGNAQYTSSFTPSTTPLTATGNTVLLTCQGPAFTDVSTSNNIIVSNTVSFSNTIVPFTGTNSWRFSNATVGNSGPISLTTRDMGPLAFGSNNFTIEAYIYMTGLPTQDTWPAQQTNTFVITGVGTPSTADGFNFIVGSTKLSIQTTDVQYLAANAHGMTGNNWYHVAVTRNNGNVTFWVNGNNVGSNTFANSVGVGSGSWIGSETGQASFFSGYISNLRALNGVALYTSNFTAPTSNLLYLSNSTCTTTMLTCQSYIDYSDNAANSMFYRLHTSLNGATVSSPYIGVGATTSNTPFANTFSFVLDSIGTTTKYLHLTGTVAPFVTPSTGAFTMEAFTLFKDTNFPYNIFSSDGLTGVYLQATNTTSISVGGTNFTISPALAGNTWYHIAANRNPTTNATTVFVNGTKSTTGNSAVTTNFNYTNYIGGNSSANGVKGYISNARVVVGANVYDSSAASITAPTAPLLPFTSGTGQYLAAANLSNFGTAFTDQFNVTWDQGTVTPSSFGPFSGAYSYYFNGTNYLAGIGPGQYNTRSLALPTLSQFTIEAWVYPLSFSSNWGNNTILSAMVAYGATNSTVLSWSFGPNLNGQLVFYYYQGSGVASLTHTATLPVGKWSHIAAVRNNNTLTLYVDGVPQSFTINSQAFMDDYRAYLNIGAYNSNFIHGYVSNLRITNTNVYPVVSTNVPVGNTAIPTAPLTSIANSTAQTVFLTAQNTSLTDTSGLFGSNVGYSFSGAGYGNNFAISPSFISNTFANATIDAWVYATSNTTNATIIDQKVSNTGGIGSWNLSINSGVLTYNYDGNNVITGATISKNTWTHVAIVKDSANVYLYANGTLGNTIAYSNVFGNTSTSIYIGASQQGGTNNFFSGYISNLRVANTNIVPSAGGPTTAPDVSNTNNIMVLGSSGKVAQSFKFYAAASSCLQGTYTNFVNDPLNVTLYDFTFECWVNLSTMPQGDAWSAPYPYYIFGTSTNASLSTGFTFAVGKTKLMMIITGNNVYTSDAVHNMAVNTWYHLAFVRKDGNMSFYINGVRNGGAFTVGLTTAPSTYINIGGVTGIAGAFFDGYISNLRFTKYKALYTASFTPPTSAYDASSYTLGSTTLMMLSEMSMQYDYVSGWQSYMPSYGQAVPSVANPFTESIADQSQYNLTAFQFGNPVVSKLNPYQTYYRDKVSKKPIFIANGSIASYGIYSPIVKLNSAQMTVVQSYASNTRFIAANTQVISIQTTVTPLPPVSGAVVTESWS